MIEKHRQQLTPANQTSLDERSYWRQCLIALSTILIIAACTPVPESASGFRLPDGEEKKGQQAFVELGCGGCHRVNDENPVTADDDALVVLGGKVIRVKTYGELVTSIINPSHRISPQFAARSDPSLGEESPMAAAKLNQVMTVQQLVDLVAYLQPAYEVLPPPTSPYPNYYPLH